MKTIIIRAFMAASILLTGCGKKKDSLGGSVPLTQEQSGKAPVARAVAQPALTAWQAGDKPRAISSFVGADWSARPLFAPGSVLNLSEAEFKALSAGERQEKSNEMLPQVASLKQLGAAVAQAGRDAASKGDTANARKHFPSLKACGAALEGPEFLLLVQKIGTALDKMADTELSKLGH